MLPTANVKVPTKQAQSEPAEYPWHRAFRFDKDGNSIKPSDAAIALAFVLMGGLVEGKLPKYSRPLPVRSQTPMKVSEENTNTLRVPFKLRPTNRKFTHSTSLGYATSKPEKNGTNIGDENVKESRKSRISALRRVRTIDRCLLQNEENVNAASRAVKPLAFATVSERIKNLNAEVQRRTRQHQGTLGG